MFDILRVPQYYLLIPTRYGIKKMKVDIKSSTTNNWRQQNKQGLGHLL